MLRAREDLACAGKTKTKFEVIAEHKLVCREAPDSNGLSRYHLLVVVYEVARQL
jgi:hypothetical protein